MNDEALAGGAGIVALGVYFVITLIYIIGYWKIHTKAGKPGWAMFVPIYNVVVLLDICRRPLWWILLLFVPIVNIFIGLILIFDLARVFNKGAGFALGLLFLPIVFYPVLGLGDAEYSG